MFIKQNQLVRHFLLAGIFLFVFACFFHPLSAFTQDLGRHLKMGQIMLTTHSVPKTNLFSYTYPDFPFINHHWLSEVVFYLLSQTLGLQGLLVVMASLAALSFVVLAGKTIAHHPLATLSVTVLFMAILGDRLDLRPEIFSYFFLSLFMVILYTYKERFSNWIFLLPLIELLWVNMHIYFILGPFVLGLFLLDEVFVTFRSHKTLRNRHIVTLLSIFVLTCLMTLLNPNGLSGALYPFNVFANYGYTIEENQPLFLLLSLGFSQASFLFFFLSVLLGLLLLTINRKQTKPLDWFLFLAFCVLAASAVRNFSLFVFALFILFVTYLADVGRLLTLPKRSAFAFYLLCFLVGCWLLISNISRNGFGFGTPTGASGGVHFVLAHHIPGPLFNNFDIGSYLDYALYPKQRVFVDGRPEAYPASFFHNMYIPMQENPAVFTQVENNYHFQSIFFAYTDQTPWAQQFVGQILHNSSWQLVYLDDTVMVLVRNTPANAQLIQHFAITQKRIVSGDFPLPTNTTALLHLSVFTQYAQWPQAEQVILEKLVAEDPDSCPVLASLLSLMQNQPSSNSALFVAQYNFHCQ